MHADARGVSVRLVRAFQALASNDGDRMDAVTVRFSEYEYYDICVDRDVLRFMATTGLGTYSDEIVIESARQVREQKQAFRDRVTDLMQRGIAPHEVEYETE